MTIALTIFLMRLLRRVTNRSQFQSVKFGDERILFLHRSSLVPYPVRTRGRLDSTGSP